MNKPIELTIPDFDDQNCGLEIIHKDGSKEYYDPVTNDTVSQEGDLLKINNTYHDYEEDATVIKQLKTYQPASKQSK